MIRFDYSVVFLLSICSLACSEEMDGENLLNPAKKGISVNYMISLSTQDDKNTKNDCYNPIVVLVHDFSYSRLERSTTPRLYVAIWQDGLIVWGKRKDNLEKTFCDKDCEIQYYQSIISPKNIDDFIKKFNSFEMIKYSGRNLFPPDSSCCRLFVMDGQRRFSLSVLDIYWPSLPFNSLHIEPEDQPIKTNWPLAVASIKELIPKTGTEINLLFRQNKKKKDVWEAVFVYPCPETLKSDTKHEPKR